LEQVASVALRTERDTYWVGEIFTLTQEVSVARRQFQALGGAFDWSSSQFNAEDWSSSTSNEARGKVVLTRTTRTYGRTAGPAALPPGRQPLTLVNEIAANGQALTDSYLVTQSGAAAHLQAVADTRADGIRQGRGQLHADGQGRGDAGQRRAIRHVDSRTRRHGQLAEISRLPAQTLRRDFQVVTPVTKRTMKRGQLLEGSLTQEMLLVPSRPGTYQLGPVRFRRF